MELPPEAPKAKNTQTDTDTAPSASATHITHYRGSIVIVAMLAALPVFFAMLALQRDAITPAWHDITAHGWQISPTTQRFLLTTLGIPLGVAVCLCIILALTIYLLRYAIYANALHGDLHQQLKRYAPLYQDGLLPQFTHFDSHGKPVLSSSHASQPLARAIQSLSQLLLIGETGSGKTTALISTAHHLTRKRSILRLAFGRVPIPVYVELGSWSTDKTYDEAWFIRLLEECFMRHNSAGLSARLPRLLRRGRLLLLFDDLDAIPSDQRRQACTTLAKCCADRYRTNNFIFACSLDLYVDEPRVSETLHTCERLILGGFHEATLTLLLDKAKLSLPGAADKRPSILRAELLNHRLQSAGTQPAFIAALAALAQQRTALPYGLGELWERYVTLLCRQTCPRDMQPERYQSFLTTLASALHATQNDAFTCAPNRTSGQAYISFLKHHQFLAACELGVSPLGDIEELDEQEATAACQSALAAGILRTNAAGTAISFSYRLLRVAFAASFLRSTNDQLGRLNAELLRPYWQIPLLFWAGDAANFADLSARLLRLADTPDSTAIRAYITSRAEVYPMILALAIAVMATGQTPSLASARSDPHTAEQLAAQAELQLRSVLDQIQMYCADPDHADRLGAALRSIEHTSGEGIVEDFSYLATHQQLSRLVRGQILTLLGLMATPRAIEALTALLDESDPVIWQALRQSLTLAGEASLQPLQSALHHPSARIQTHAAEALAAIGDAAAAAALAALDAPAPAERAAAARTVGTLHAGQAEARLIALLDDQDIAVQAAATHALEQFATPQVVLAFEQHATVPSPEMRARIAEALGVCRDAHAVPTLIRLLDDPVAEVVAAAATALGKVGDDRAIIALRKRRDDYNPWIQTAVVEALRRLGDIPL